jgi:hypothetical protein
MKESMLICVVEKALYVYHVIDRHARDTLSQAFNISHNEVTLDVASMRPVILTELDVASWGIHSNSVSGSQELGKIVKATTTATASLKQSFTLEAVNTTLFKDSKLIHLKAESIKAVSIGAGDSMLHKTKAFEVILLHSCITHIHDGKIIIFGHLWSEKTKCCPPKELYHRVE